MKTGIVGQPRLHSEKSNKYQSFSIASVDVLLSMQEFKNFLKNTNK